MDILRALEERAWHIKPEEIEEVRRKENWKFWQDGNPSVASSDGGITDEAYFRLTNNAHRAKTMVHTLQALLETAMEVQQELESPVRRKPKPIFVKQSKGITSLPDEVLSRVFASGVPPGERKQAILFSHICRYFRAVALGEPNLWTTLHSKARADELETFISRNGNTDLHVVVSVDQGSYVPTFIKKCSPTVERWKSLTVVDPLGPHRNRNYSVNKVLKFFIGEPMQHLNRLETLRVFDEESAFLSDVDNPWQQSPEVLSRFVPLWNSPHLRDLHLTGYVPTFAPTFASVATLSFAIYTSRRNYRSVISDFLSFLSAAPLIEDLHVDVHNAFNTDAEVADLPVAQCPSIRSLSLRFTRFGLAGQDNRFIYGLTRTLSIPSLEHLSVSVEFDYRKWELLAPSLDGMTGIRRLRHLSTALLPNNYAHSELRSLTYDLSLQDYRPNPASNITNPLPISFTIPLDRVPGITSLTLKTFLHTHFARDQPFEPLDLRVLRLHKCHDMDSESLFGLVQSLKDAGAWNRIQTFTVENCKALQYAVAVAAVGVHKLQFIEI